MAADVRPPAVAGQFYAADGRQLAHQLEACFTDARGPGALPTRRRSTGRRVVAAVVPHAGYPYSGAIAAHVYARIAADRPPGSVVILGVDHQGAGRGAVVSMRPWLTPLGPTPVDLDLARALTAGPVHVDEAAQAQEHSIEVQLPFLEYVLPRPSFVPVQVRFGSLRFLEEVAGVVREATAGKDVLLLASTDFSHYVPVEEARTLDHLAIEAILASDPRRLYEVVERKRISMCGIAPTTVLLSAVASRGLVPRLLRWGHSGEVEPMSEVVGYAAIVLEEPDRPAPPVK
ncbi:MAG TPA: AmmeMemoRadiSam system protein B [Thermoplasmata archaeon]|nr:AmmeMemoRadiSam system protein B [Thermoplasmata archaeon]